MSQCVILILSTSWYIKYGIDRRNLIEPFKSLLSLRCRIGLINVNDSSYPTRSRYIFLFYLGGVLVLEDVSKTIYLEQLFFLFFYFPYFSSFRVEVNVEGPLTVDNKG